MPAWLEDMLHGPDLDGSSLDAATLASLDRGLTDIAGGRNKPLEEYDRPRSGEILDRLAGSAERRIRRPISSSG